jgi:hypothetical protein
MVWEFCAWRDWMEGTPSYVILNGGEAGVKDPTSA